VVAAGHPLTAQAGADVLRAGGNAVDAAIAAMLMSWVAESPLTGPGAGGFMQVHTSGGETHLLDFFVAAPGKDAAGPPGELQPIDVHFSEDAIQVFHIVVWPEASANLNMYLQKVPADAEVEMLRTRMVEKFHACWGVPEGGECKE